jgi:hypothetical protein
MMRTASAIIALAALAALTGCRVHYEDPVVPTLSVITVTVAPDPLRLLVVCPPGDTNCFGSLDATLTIAESGGLGGRVEYVDVTVYNVILARNDSQTRLDSNWLKANAGTDRIDASGRLPLRFVIQGYPFPVGQQPQLEFVIGVRFIDDRNNVVETTRRIPLV